MGKESSAGGKKDRISLGKKLLLEEIEREFSSSENTFFSRFDRLSVADMSELRRNLEKVSKRTLVMKHSLAKKVLEKNKVADAVRFLEGSVLVTLGAKEPQLASKTLVDFVKGHENLQLKGMILDGKVYDSSFIRELAKLPSRKELLTLAVTWMKFPIARLAMTLGGVLQSFVSVLNEVQKKKAQAQAGEGPKS